ncbi:reverse transcriptase domain-containing protein [Apibacter sp. HY039]|uniref:reverse transcriptase domain-containing protein n=1 Tax=Apibacter sp. HY039 TaxID=2501476 RepID=UPI0013E3AC9C|nr:reverse transcriptase domain-containing protein [Apibacter sp. HY039]
MEEDFDKDILNSFLEVETDRQLASVLDIPYKNLIYNIYKLPDEKKYEIFEISKRNKSKRQICAPISGIKNIQKKLSIILNNLHSPKYCAHGYVKDKSIKTNAQIHVKKRILINIDLKDFFTSINFGRIRGLFKSYPFNFNDKVATILAQVCCYNGCLPQGAPSSPILSNYICRRLDNQILDLSQKCKVDYTRYADDLTFSTNLKELPKEIGVIRDNELFLSNELISIIESNGFVINRQKIRFALKNNRQEVTGLIVNNRININRKFVRHVRAMLHAWEKYGLENAAIEHFEKYNYKNKKVENYIFSFLKEISGKIGYIGYIKGKNNSVYRNLFRRIKELNPEIKLPVPKDIIESNTAIVFCEGKTDAIHIETALKYLKSKGDFIDLNIGFHPYEGKEISNSTLYDICKNWSITKKSDRVDIFLFDGDDRRYNRKNICQYPNFYKHWGDKVYSVMLPIPPHRDFEEICIEHYYTDDEIKTKGNKERRLYLSTEFDPNTCFHKEENVNFANRKTIRSSYPKIIDGNDRVLNEFGVNVALTKMAFAENIANKTGEFKKISLENFKVLFDVLLKILEDSKDEN